MFKLFSSGKSSDLKVITLTANIRNTYIYITNKHPYTRDAKFSRVLSVSWKSSQINPRPQPNPGAQPRSKQDRARLAKGADGRFLLRNGQAIWAKTS